MLRNFPRNFWAFVQWVRKNPWTIPSKFPTKFSKFPCEKSKKNSPTSFCRSAGRKLTCITVTVSLFSLQKAVAEKNSPSGYLRICCNYSHMIMVFKLDMSWFLTCTKLWAFFSQKFPREKDFASRAGCKFEDNLTLNYAKLTLNYANLTLNYANLTVLSGPKL